MNHFLRYLLLPFLVMLCAITGAFAQEGPQYGLSAYPSFSGARLGAGTTINNAALDSLEARETSRPSIAFGLAAQWRGAKAGFRTGIQLTNTGYRTVQEPVPTGEPAPPGAVTRSIAYRSMFIEMPAEILFLHEINTKDRVNFMMGVGAAYNIGNYEDTTYFSGERIGTEKQKLSNDNFRRLHLSFQTGVGWQRDFGQKVVFFVQPTFQFWFNGLLLEPGEVNRNLYSIGLKTGILLKAGRSWDQ